MKEGGYEFDITLKEKPISNKIEFSIETKGLNFFYQSKLTQKHREAGMKRPENIDGSYAVYHKTKGGLNSAYGKNYNSGKAFNILRPKIIDSAGTEVWGELNIDIENKTLTITIPQDFLDNGVYPIRHAAGLTFGYDTVGGSSGFWTHVGGTAYATKGTPAENGILDKIYYYSGSTGGDQAVALYNDNAGAIGTLIEKSGVVAISPDGVHVGWKSVSLTATVVIDTPYWVAHNADDYDVLYYDEGLPASQSFWPAYLDPLNDFVDNPDTVDTEYDDIYYIISAYGDYTYAATTSSTSSSTSSTSSSTSSTSSSTSSTSSTSSSTSSITMAETPRMEVKKQEQLPSVKVKNNLPELKIHL